MAAFAQIQANSATPATQEIVADAADAELRRAQESEDAHQQRANDKVAQDRGRLELFPGVMIEAAEATPSAASVDLSTIVEQAVEKALAPLRKELEDLTAVVDFMSAEAVNDATLSPKRAAAELTPAKNAKKGKSDLSVLASLSDTDLLTSLGRCTKCGWHPRDKPMSFHIEMGKCSPSLLPNRMKGIRSDIAKGLHPNRTVAAGKASASPAPSPSRSLSPRARRPSVSVVEARPPTHPLPKGRYSLSEFHALIDQAASAAGAGPSSGPAL